GCRESVRSPLALASGSVTTIADYPIMFQSLPTPILAVLLPFATLFRPRSWTECHAVAAWHHPVQGKAHSVLCAEKPGNGPGGQFFQIPSTPELHQM
ncbi:MAG: hypothetical protein ACOYKZ_05440, partial [Chlamydiia bacterium]